MDNSGWATFSADLSPALCLDLQPFKKCNYLLYYTINKHWSGGHRAKDSVVSANVNSDKDEKVFDHGDSCRKPQMKPWSRHSSEGGKKTWTASAGSLQNKLAVQFGRSIVKGPHLGHGITSLVLGGHFSAVRGLNMEKCGYWSKGLYKWSFLLQRAWGCEMGSKVGKGKR